jgi:hypothetical protein
MKEINDSQGVVCDQGVVVAQTVQAVSLSIATMTGAWCVAVKGGSAVSTIII